MAIDEAKFSALVDRMITEMGVVFGLSLVLVGDRLGLYRALVELGPATSSELAKHTGTFERYVREWLAAQAAAGYVSYDHETGRYFMTEEQAMVFADETSPLFVPGAFEAAAAMIRDEPKITEAFQSGRGVGWHEHDRCLFRGTERFFKPGYATNLAAKWIPALEGVEAKLKRGARVADVGCGHGASTIIMAKAYPNSEFFGYDYHDLSIQRARELAAQAGVAERVHFEAAAATQYPGVYDLIAFFDCLHDMGDPVSAARHAHEALKPDGTLMLVEPFSRDELADNLTPVGRMFYSASTMICTPASLSQEVGLGLGAQAGPRRLSDVLREGGFRKVRVATETPFNLVIEARP